ncbi:hypothetical protein BVRB_6g151300 [Beta vulgaris subsp. vulgaris]|nr:hypothetical protein BVRB_6g151300 [Beta vulgaris subsp. vulgaris]
MRIVPKAKGLAELKFYCEYCKKQCKDNNGFKIHFMNKFHQLQLQIFSDYRHEFTEAFSKDLEDGFLEHLMRFHEFRHRVSAKVVLKGYMKQKEGNVDCYFYKTNTKWRSFSEFMMHLFQSRNKKCLVERIHGEWFVSYNVEDSEPLLKRKRVNLSHLEDKIANQYEHDVSVGGGGAAGGGYAGTNSYDEVNLKERGS